MKWPVVIASTSVVLAGCTPTPDVTITDADNGGHVEINVGDVVDILLADDYEKSKTQWRDDQPFDWDILKPLGSKYEPGPGTYTDRLEGKSAGTVHLTLVQSDTGDRVPRRFAVDITVRS